MSENFREAQARQRRRSIFFFVALGLIYFLSILGCVVAVRLVLSGFSPAAVRTLDENLVDVRPAEPSERRRVLTWEAVVASLVAGGFLVGVQVWFARRYAVAMVLDALNAHEPDGDDRYHVRFRNTVEEMAIAAGRGGQVRAVVVPSVALTAFAAEDVSSGAVVGMTESLIARLNREQTQAVVGHEVSHLRENDAMLSSVSCAMLAPFVALAELAEEIEEATSEGNDRGGGMASKGLIALVTLCMRLVSTTMSRRREFLADAGSVELTRNPLALAEALHEIGHRHHFLGGRASAFAPLFILDPTSSPLSQQSNWQSNLFSTHPPLKDRIDVLLGMAHAGPEVLGSAPSEAGAPEPAAGLDGQWLIRVGTGWSSPLTLTELLAHEAFGPEVWITPKGAFRPVRALDDPVVRRALEAESRRESSAAGQPDAQDAGDPTVAATSVAAQPPELGVPTAQGCPHCMVPLFAVDYEGVRVLHCHQCRGHLVSDQHVRRILARREMTFTDDFRERVRRWHRENPFRPTRDNLLNAPDPMGAPACPECGRPMTRRFYSYQYFVSVDRCFTCKVTWFDAEELETLQVLLEDKNR